MLILYGGAFNPPTIAHRKIIETIKKMYPKAHVLLIPVGDDYEKNNLIDSKHRLKMCELLVDNLENVSVSDYEINNKFLGTIGTMEHFNKESEDLMCVIGADNLIEIDEWIRYEELLKTYQFIVVKRGLNNIDTYINKYSDLWVKKPQIIEFDLDISSSKVRNNLEENSNMLTKNVYKYIKEKKLY